MNIVYVPAITKGQLHKIEIDGQRLETTKIKEVISFSKTRIFSKVVWKELKEAIRLGNKLEVIGGGLFD